MRRRPSGLTLIVATAVLLGTTPCGTRVQDVEAQSSPSAASIPSAAGGAGSSSDEIAGRSATGSGGDSEAVAAQTGLTRGAGVGTGASGEPRPSGGRPTSPGVKAGATTDQAVRPTSEPSAAGSRSTGGESGVVPPRAPGSAPAQKSPVVVASVGTLSGPIGTLLLPVVRGMQVWVKAVNNRSGVNGHRVEVIVYDDGGDPARHRAQVQDAVEHKNAVAFLAGPDFVAGRSSVEYITAKRIPVIGGDTGAAWFYESPMYFPQASANPANLYAGIAGPASLLVPAGKTKLASLMCVEAEACDRMQKTITDYAKSLGFELVYSGRVTVAQPDYTAECLNAARAGAQVVFAGSEPNTDRRMAASCARQNFHPIFTTLASAISPEYADDPNFDGLVGASNVFPWFQTGTAATDEYQQALRSLGQGVASGVGVATGWVAAKLFEKAASALPEPPTSAALLQGLWSLRDDDLGGLTQPLTFVADQPAKPVACWFNVALKKGTWVSPDGFKRTCHPYPPPA